MAGPQSTPQGTASLRPSSMPVRSGLSQKGEQGRGVSHRAGGSQVWT